MHGLLYALAMLGDVLSAKHRKKNNKTLESGMYCLKTKAVECICAECKGTCSGICNKYHKLDQSSVTCERVPPVLPSGL